MSTDLQYSEHTPRQFYGLDSWTANWEAVSERDTIYIKIDDDIVFIEDETIGNIVKRLVENPRYFAVSANVVNNPALSWVHRRLGVFEPYWPVSHPSCCINSGMDLTKPDANDCSDRK